MTDSLEYCPSHSRSSFVLRLLPLYILVFLVSSSSILSLILGKDTLTLAFLIRHQTRVGHVHVHPSVGYNLLYRHSLHNEPISDTGYWEILHSTLHTHDTTDHDREPRYTQGTSIGFPPGYTHVLNPIRFLPSRSQHVNWWR